MSDSGEQPPKRPRGRPSEYKPEYCEQIVEFMANGRSFTAFAASLGTYAQRLIEWAKVHPEFQEARRAASAASEAWWDQQGQMGVWVDEGGAKLNSSLYQFIMGRRFRQRFDVEEEKKQEEQTTPEEVKLLLEMYKDLKGAKESE